MLAYQGEAEDAGAVVAFWASVTRAAIDETGIAIWVNEDTEPVLYAHITIDQTGVVVSDL